MLWHLTPELARNPLFLDMSMRFKMMFLATLCFSTFKPKQNEIILNFITTAWDNKCVNLSSE